MPDKNGVLRILQADDDESFRLLVENMISNDEELSASCRVTFCQDGNEVVEYLRGNGEYADRYAHPLPHLLLIDQRMVRMDGLDTIRTIREEDLHPGTPAFLLSSSDQRSLLRECYRIGGAFCLRKPLEFAEFRPLYARLVDFAVNVLELPRRQRS